MRAHATARCCGGITARTSRCSRLFYNGGLIAAAPRSATHTLVGWEALLAPHCRSATREEELPSAPPLPLLLWGVSGVLERDIDSPSYFNRAESQVVVDIVEALLESPHVECGTIDIETRRETRCETCARDMVLDPVVLFSTIWGTAPNTLFIACA